MSIKNLLTVKELAAELKVSPHWIYRQIHRKRNPLPSMKLGDKMYRFDCAKVVKWMAFINKLQPKSILSAREVEAQEKESDRFNREVWE